MISIRPLVFINKPSVSDSLQLKREVNAAATEHPSIFPTIAATINKIVIPHFSPLSNNWISVLSPLFPPFFYIPQSRISKINR